MAVGVQVTFDASDPARLGASGPSCWATSSSRRRRASARGRRRWRRWGCPRTSSDSAYAIVDPAGAGPRLFFQRVPEAKTAKNRVHLDVNVGAGLAGATNGRHTSAPRPSGLCPRGHTVCGWLEQRGELWVVLQDPDGNEFCLQ